MGFSGHYMSSGIIRGFILLPVQRVIKMVMVLWETFLFIPFRHSYHVCKRKGFRGNSRLRSYGRSIEIVYWHFTYVLHPLVYPCCVSTCPHDL